MLSYLSSSNAQCAMSTLNSKVTALRNCMAWSSIRGHLTGVEDMDPNRFDFELVAGLWATSPRLRLRHNRCKQRTRKKKVQERMLEDCEGEEDWGFLARAQSEGAISSDLLSTISSG